MAGNDGFAKPNPLRALLVLCKSGIGSHLSASTACKTVIARHREREKRTLICKNVFACHFGGRFEALACKTGARCRRRARQPKNAPAPRRGYRGEELQAERHRALRTVHRAATRTRALRTYRPTRTHAAPHATPRARLTTYLTCGACRCGARSRRRSPGTR